MWKNILLGSLLIALTILIHAITTRSVIYHVNKRSKQKTKSIEVLKGVKLARLVLVLFFASILEAIIWAWTYHYIGAIDNFDKALYFSIVTITTLGYGDITLHESWRLLSSFEAAIGIIIFGWSTAIVMAAVQRLYFGTYDNQNNKPLKK
jgi:hypothetical protein